MSIGFTFTVIWFIVAIALPMILEKRGFGITNESAGFLCIILMIIGLHPFYLATVVASKLKTSPEQLKQKKYAVEFSSYEELMQYCEPLLTENGYRKILQSKANTKDIHISAYTRPTETDEIFCFAVSYTPALSMESLDVIRRITVSTFGKLVDRLNFNRANQYRKLHYINLICVDEENEAFKKLQQMPTENNYAIRGNTGRSRYEVGRSDMFISLSFARNMLFIPQPFYGDVFDGSNPKRFYKIHMAELSKFLDFSREIEDS